MGGKSLRPNGLTVFSDTIDLCEWLTAGLHERRAALGFHLSAIIGDQRECLN